MTTFVARQPKGIPTGGRFAATTHAEPEVSIKVPSNPGLYRLVFEDSPAPEEARSYARQALEQTLDGDDFDVVYASEQKAGIREEGARDDAVDNALERLSESVPRPHHFGADLAAELLRSHEERSARDIDPAYRGQ